MKKFGLLFLLAVSPLTAFSTNSQNVVKFHIDFDSKDFYLGEINGKNYISSDRYHLEFTSDKQSPALPYISISIPIKESQKYIGHTVTKREKLYMDNISIIPNTIFLKADSKKKVTKVEPVDYQGKIYPSSSIIYAGFYNCRGNCKLSFLLCPFRYDDSTKELFLTKTIDLSITMSDNAIATNRPNSKQTNRLLSDTVYHCIILTSRNLAPQYQKLANWKSRKGVRTKLLTVEDIYDEDLSNESNALKIKRVLNDYYELDSLNGLKYLLLGGDASIIPVQKGFVSFENGSSTENKLIPTDLYYACFDSMDWDTNGNGLPGEIADSIDITPDVGIGRIPLSDTTEVSSVIDRIICYECNPDVNKWNNNILFGGYKLCHYYETELGDTISDAHYCGEWIYSHAIENNWNGDRVRLYDTVSDINGKTGFTSTNLIDELQKGYSFLNIDTHGNNIGWSTEDGYYVYLNAINQSNMANTVITTGACHTNAFDNNIFLAKSFFQSSNSGVLAYWGCSREGWYSSSETIPNSYWGNSVWYEKEFYSALFDQEFYDHRRLGDITNNSKDAGLPFCNMTLSPIRWLHLGLNLMGDPELPIYIDAPIKFVDVSFRKENDRLYINPHKVSTICFINNYAGTTDYVVRSYYGEMDFPYHAGQSDVCITSPGCIPYMAIYNSTPFIQNRVLFGDTHVIATDKTYIGSNVSNTFTSGPVVVENGRTEVELSNGVEITNDFEVLLGAELIIN